MTVPARPLELDDAIRDATRHGLVPGEMVVSWVTVAATRSADDGGTVLVLVSDDAMPAWQVKGMLTEALDLVREGALDRHEDGE